MSRHGKPTLRDVAQRAGVSHSAVSRAFTPGASVSPAMRHKVETAARELGYAPNALASSLTTGRTKLIGLVSNNFRNPLFLQVFDLFTRGLQDRGLRPLLVNLSDQTEPEDSVAMLRAYSVDAVVVASSTLPPSFATAFRTAGLPVVHAFGRLMPEPPVDTVTIDNVACGQLAARALIRRGYGHIGFLGGPEAATSTQDRLRGFMAEMARHTGIRVSSSFAAAYTFDAGRAEMQRLIAAGDIAQGYFGGDDVLSIGALSALTDAGHDVPGEVGLIGLNDMDIAGWENIGLTTIRQPIDAIVAASITRVMELLDAPDTPPVARAFPCDVVERKTLPPV